MNTYGSPRLPDHTQHGPPLFGLALISVALFAAGLIVSSTLGGTVPSPYAHESTIRTYFSSHHDAAKWSGILTFASSVPLAIYACTASSRLRRLGVTAPGATIALGGGLLSAGALSMSGLLIWTASRAEVRTDIPLLRALHDLGFVTGGTAHVVFLGLLIAGIAVPGLILRLFPRPLAWVGLVIAVVAEVSTVSLIWQSFAVLLPIARFPGLLWLIAVGWVLPKRYPHRAAPEKEIDEHEVAPRVPSGP